MKSVRSVALLVLLVVFALAVHAAPQKKFGKGRAVQPETEKPAVASAEEEAPAGDSAEGGESEETLEQIQAKSAQYSYDTSVNDTINDHSITRQEERNGLSLKGMYSYSDGFFRRTVHYEADDKGYRVVKEINIPIGDGPKIDPEGKADVSSSLTGSYSITADDIAKPQRKEVPDEDASGENAPEDDDTEDQDDE